MEPGGHLACARACAGLASRTKGRRKRGSRDPRSSFPGRGVHSSQQEGGARGNRIPPLLPGHCALGGLKVRVALTSQEVECLHPHVHGAGRVGWGRWGTLETVLVSTPKPSRSLGDGRPSAQAPAPLLSKAPQDLAPSPQPLVLGPRIPSRLPAWTSHSPSRLKPGAMMLMRLFPPKQPEGRVRPLLLSQLLGQLGSKRRPSCGRNSGNWNRNWHSRRCCQDLCRPLNGCLHAGDSWALGGHRGPGHLLMQCDHGSLAGRGGEAAGEV